MDKNKQREFDALQEKVFGKDAPDRSIKTGLDDLMKQARLVEADLDEINKQVLDNSTSFDAILKQQTSEVQQLTNSDLDAMEEEMKKDFSVIAKKELSVDMFSDIYGQEEAIKDSVIAFNRPYVLKDETLKCLNTILIYGPKGSGKHTIINEVSKQLDRKIVSIDLSKYETSEDEKIFIQDIYSALSVKHSILVFENIETFYTGFTTMFTSFFKTGSFELKKRYVLNKGQLQETNTTFVENAIHSLDANDHYLVCITNLKKNKIVDILGIEFMNSIHDIIETINIDSSIDLLIDKEINNLENKLSSIYTLKLNNIKDYYKKEYISKDGGYSLINITNVLMQALQQYKLENKDINEIEFKYDSTLFINDIDITTFNKKEDSVDIDEIKKELDEIVGLQEVKQYVLSLEDNYKIQKLRAQKGLKTTEISKHMIFTGNPGTGKTTIARLISKYLRAIGILSGGQLVEVTRADLVGKYVGHTAPLTTKVIESALGGVLFIDEAYSLYRGKDDSFGLECIDTLVKCMEDYRDNLVVILAGYKKEMEAFLESNSGLKSRFPNIVNFKDYSADELVQIAYSTAKSKDYYINDECKQALYDYFDKVQKDNSQTSGNGRMARNKVEEAILKQGSRILKDENQDIQELKLCDFNLDENSFVR